MCNPTMSAAKTVLSPRAGPWAELWANRPNVSNSRPTRRREHERDREKRRRTRPGRRKPSPLARCAPALGRLPDTFRLLEPLPNGHFPPKVAVRAPPGASMLGVLWAKRRSNGGFERPLSVLSDERFGHRVFPKLADAYTAAGQGGVVRTLWPHGRCPSSLVPILSRSGFGKWPPASPPGPRKVSIANRWPVISIVQVAFWGKTRPISAPQLCAHTLRREGYQEAPWGQQGRACTTRKSSSSLLCV